jgi:hypothetical protein
MTRAVERQRAAIKAKSLREIAEERVGAAFTASADQGVRAWMVDKGKLAPGQRARNPGGPCPRALSVPTAGCRGAVRDATVRSEQKIIFPNERWRLFPPPFPAVRHTPPGRPSTAQRSGPDPVEDRSGDFGELVDLLRGEPVEDQAPDRLGMAGDGGGERGAADVGDGGVAGAAAAVPLNQAAPRTSGLPLGNAGAARYRREKWRYRLWRRFHLGAVEAADQPDAGSRSSGAVHCPFEHAG